MESTLKYSQIHSFKGKISSTQPKNRVGRRKAAKLKQSGRNGATTAMAVTTGRNAHHGQDVVASG